MLDELAHAGPEHLDEGFIAGFDRKQGFPDPDADIAAFEAHGLGSASVVADLGTGTGQFAIPAARRFGRVIAVDVSPARYTAADYAEHIRTEYSTFRWLLEPMLAAAGFEITDVSYERRLYGAYTCVKIG
jgi:SAM-dependent methyltransferase